MENIPGKNAAPGIPRHCHSPPALCLPAQLCPTSLQAPGSPRAEITSEIPQRATTLLFLPLLPKPEPVLGAELRVMRAGGSRGLSDVFLSPLSTRMRFPSWQDLWVLPLYL